MLLMKDVYAEAPRIVERAELIVPAGKARTVYAARGQLMRITAGEAGAVASLFGFTIDPSVFLSVHHTRVFSNSYMLGLGMRLVTNRRRPLMVLGQDTVGEHDLLLPASTTAYLMSQGLRSEKGCVETVRDVLATAGHYIERIPDPINLFMNVGLNLKGELVPKPGSVRKGDYVTFRVLIDTTFVVSACNTGIPHNDQPGELKIAVAEDLADF